MSKKCPRCNKNSVDGMPAVSRRDKVTEICGDCSISEAMVDFYSELLSIAARKFLKEQDSLWLNRKRRNK